MNRMYLLTIACWTICGLLRDPLGTQAHTLTLEAVNSSVRLPSPRAFIPAIYDGEDSIYLLGGTSIIYDIVRYSVSQDRVHFAGNITSGGTPLHLGGATWVGGGDIMYFGGGSPFGGHKADIWNINVGNGAGGDQLANMTLVGSLGRSYGYQSAVWDRGDNVYVVGGTDGGSPVPLNRIMKYSFATNRTTLEAGFPSPRYTVASIWDEARGKVFMFGGSGGNAGGPFLSEIVTYDPWTGNSTLLQTRLPYGLGFTCAAWTGTEAYLIGGTSSQGVSMAPMLRFTPRTGELDQVEVSGFPRGLTSAGCSYVPKLNRIYVFGGMPSAGGTDRIFYIDLGMK